MEAALEVAGCMFATAGNEASAGSVVIANNFNPLTRSQQKRGHGEIVREAVTKHPRDSVLWGADI